MAPPSPDLPAGVGAGVRARRANSRLSTGPRSAAGRRRTAQNARRHGLAVPIAALPEYDAATERLASLIAGADAEGARLVAARRLAEAEIDLFRIRRAKLMLLAGRGWMPEARRVGGRLAAGRHAPSPGTHAGHETHSKAEPTAVAVAGAIGETAQAMLRLDRYERRALSRRNSAARAFDGPGRNPRSVRSGVT